MANRLVILGIVLAGSALTLFATARSQPGATGGIKTHRPLPSKNSKTGRRTHEQIFKAYTRLLKERKKMTAELSAIIADPENHVHRRESVRQAMYSLGGLRAVEGIDVLVTYIGFPWLHHPDAGEYPGPARSGRNKPPLKGSPEEPRWIAQQFPAINALVAIGEPCIGAVITKLSKTDNVAEHELCTAVLKKLQRHASVRKKLKQAIPKVPPRKSAALQKALKALDEKPVSNDK